MSASAVPSTLESPQEAGATDGAPPAPAIEDGATDTDKAPPAFADDEINGAVLAREVSVPPPAQEPSRRGGPATLMSPAVAHAGDVPPSPPLAPENAVVDVGAPAHAFIPAGHAGSPPYAGGPVMPHGAHGGMAGDAARPRRGTSTTFLVMVVVGVVGAVVVLAGIVIGLFYVAERRKAEAERLQRAGVVAPATAAEAPRGPLRFGGPKARLGVITTGTLDPEAIRSALATALPRIDACFAAAELEPPNHESAAYDLDVQPNGDVKRAEAATTVNRASKLDACVLSSLRAVRLPKSARASTVKLTFSAPLDVH
jgi:hypothetical protein